MSCSWVVFIWWIYIKIQNLCFFSNTPMKEQSLAHLSKCDPKTIIPCVSSHKEPLNWQDDSLSCTGDGLSRMSIKFNTHQMVRWVESHIVGDSEDFNGWSQARHRLMTKQTWALTPAASGLPWHLPRKRLRAVKQGHHKLLTALSLPPPAAWRFNFI